MAVTEALDDENIKVIAPFQVARILRHWVWLADDAPVAEPSLETLAFPLNDNEIARINSGSIPEAEAAHYTECHLLAPWHVATGIKFTVVIPQPSRSLSIEAQQELRQRLSQILDNTQRVVNTSLHEGAGFGAFLIMGVVAFKDYHCINSELIEQINSIGLQTLFGVRTYTHLVLGTPGTSLPIVERMPLKLDVEKLEVQSVESFIDQGEGSGLEFKAAAFVDFGHWVHSGYKTVDAPDKIFREGALKAAVGLLNARGGKVVIGIGELKRFPKLEGSGMFREYGGHFISGLVLDFQNHDWDWFERRLWESLRHNIEPSPSMWITISRIHTETAEVCVLSVREPTKGWFYLRGEPAFFVRQGNSTRALAGPEADEYKRVVLRG